MECAAADTDAVNFAVNLREGFGILSNVQMYTLLGRMKLNPLCSISEISVFKVAFAAVYIQSWLFLAGEASMKPKFFTLKTLMMFIDCGSMGRCRDFSMVIPSLV